uniref:Uncharacterized protein n=1 Tax=Oryza brachyantha TaxID=4533 RepID=J3L026_ORYBR
FFIFIFFRFSRAGPCVVHFFFVFFVCRVIGGFFTWVVAFVPILGFFFLFFWCVGCVR